MKLKPESAEPFSRVSLLMSESRIWIDGCFDFAHHGHAGAMRQARQLGTELYVGVHTDAAILENKGPSVMTLEERMLAVEGCRWCTQAVAGAPYVTDYRVMDEYGCKYVVHGDDITTDKDGNDCYQEVKDMGRFKVVKRTANISTTDLVGRMLLCNRAHHLKGLEGLKEMDMTKFSEYAAGPDAKSPGANVWLWEGELRLVVAGSKPAGRFVYIDGGFDLFNPGHIVALRGLREANPDCTVVVGVADDASVNAEKGLNFPIMNLFERSLCVLQSKYVDGIIVGAPKPTMDFLGEIGQVEAVYHGKTRLDDGHYKEVEGVFRELLPHKWEALDVESIVARVLENRALFEARQRKKGGATGAEIS